MARSLEHADCEHSNAPSGKNSPVPPGRNGEAAGRARISADDIKRVSYFRMDPKTDIRLGQVDGNLCTHIILAFVRINANSELVVANESDYSYLEEVAEFKRRFPHVRVMVSAFNDQEFNGFARLASPLNNSDNRLKFARSAVEFLQRYQLDGLDLDWEFPNFPTNILTSREHERSGLTKILKSLRSAIVENFFDRQLAEQHQITSRNSSHTTTTSNNESHVEPHLLTVAVGGQEAILRSSYELKQLTNLCDWLNVMSYDYFLYKPYSPFTGPNSPLFPLVDPYVPILSKLSLSWTLNRLLQEQLDRSKLVMGIPCYARAYRLLFRNTRAAAFTLSAGIKSGQMGEHLNYREVLELLTREDTIVEFDKRARVPYLLTDGGYLWISYENQQSVQEKVHHILEAGLGGYMTWNLNSDDFIGSNERKIADDPKGRVVDESASEKFPLHRAMFDEVIKFLAESA